jgi:hypothetical protein
MKGVCSYNNTLINPIAIEIEIEIEIMEIEMNSFLSF